MTSIEPVLTRRGFIKVGGALCVTIALPDLFGASGGQAEAASLDATKLASWLEIRDDGSLIARTGRAEMGVNMSAYYRQMIAEELRIKPESITLVMGDTDRTPDGGFSADFMNGAQNLRKVSAYTYEALLGLAATRLSVAASTLSVRDGVVTSSAGSGKVSYAELVRGQQLDLTIPINGTLAKMNDAGTALLNTAGLQVSGMPRMKPVAEYTIVGTNFPASHIAEKVTAKTEWIADLRLPGMMHARMLRPASLGGTLTTLGEIDKKRFPTAEIVRRGNLVAVVSPNEWEAVAAARAVAPQTRWSDWSGLPGSGGLASVMRANAKPSGSRGDAEKVAAAMGGASKTVAVTYEQPFVKHAPIGPYIAVADVKPDGTAMVWSHTAQAQGMRAHLAHMMGVSPDKVTVRWMEGSGQYGRLSQGGDGAEADAVILSQQLGKPVRVQWTLQEDFEWSSASPAWVADLKAGLDANGKLVAIQSEIFAPHMRDFRMLGAILAGLPDITTNPLTVGPATFGVGAVAMPYNIPVMLHKANGMPNIGIDGPETSGIRGNIMRTPNQRQHVFALESLLNESAAAARVDPIQFRLDHTSDQRLIDIIKKTADAAGWESRPSPNPSARRTGSQPVKGHGMACMYRFGTYWAGIAEVEVTPSTGVVKVTKFTLGIDPGKVVNPRHLELNGQGGVVMGLSEVLKEELTFDQSKVTSSNWSRYKILTMAEVPEIKIVMTSRDDQGFGGGGEAANGLPQPAVLAAVFDALGVQPRRTPLTPAYMQQLLKA